jgi:PAS domain S-box-containing protein
MSTPTPFRWIKPAGVSSYAIAVLSTAAAVGTDIAVNRLFAVNPSVSLFLCAIMFVAWIGGTGPALLATALTALGFDYFFMQPDHSLFLTPREIPRLVLFIVAALFVVWISAAQRRATVLLQRARNEQQVMVAALQRLNEALRIENAERQRAEERTRQAETELQVTIDTVPVGIARYRRDGAIDFVNQTYRSFTGLSLENMDGSHWGPATHSGDLPALEREWHAHMEKGEAFETEQRIRSSDGEYRWHWVRRVPLRDDNGEVIAWYGAGYDIEDRKRTEAKLAEARRELQLTIDTIPTLVASYDADGTPVFANQTWRDFVGPDFAIEKLFGIIHSDDLPAVRRLWDEHLVTGEPFQSEQRLRGADGDYRLHFMKRVPYRDETGKVIRWYGSGHDIEDRKRAEDALRQSEAALTRARQELQLTIDTVPVLMLRHRADGVIDFVNQVGRSYSGLVSTNWSKRTSSATHPDDVARLEQAWDAALATGRPFETEARLRRADGEYRWFVTRRVPLRNGDGDVVAWYAAAYDVEDQKRAEQALRQSEARLARAERELRLTLDSIPTLAWRARPDGFAEYLNKGWLDYTGLPREQALGWDWQSAVHPDDRQGLHDGWLKMLDTEEPSELEARMRRFDGEYRWFMFRTSALRDEAGSLVAWYGTNTDIEDRKRAESSLQRTAAYLEETQRLSATGSFAWDVVTGRRFWSDQTYRIMGFDRRAKPDVDQLIERVHPDDRAVAQQQIDDAARGANNLDYEIRLLMPDGKIKHLNVLAHRVRFESGNEEIVGALIDNTEMRKSQEALNAAQSALTHASRVATLGEISATIAHEVNQPLAAIVANGQACLRFLRRENPDLGDVRGAVEWIVKDGNRAAEVIQRVRGLLKKADAERAPVDINEIINEVAVLLQRELAAKYVTPRLQLAPAIPLSVGDRVQLQQVIINLVMNGVEAMQGVTSRPHALEIRSYEDEGQQVVVAVKDSGVGLTAETADHLFDAFFSTKPSGLGIGLSICRSIVQDHGGRLWATHNNGGPGATFQFALPSYRGSAA